MHNYKKMLHKYGLDEKSFSVESIGKSQCSDEKPSCSLDVIIDIDELDFDSPSDPIKLKIWNTD